MTLSVIENPDSEGCPSQTSQNFKLSVGSRPLFPGASYRDIQGHIKRTKRLLNEIIILPGRQTSSQMSEYQYHWQMARNKRLKILIYNIFRTLQTIPKCCQTQTRQVHLKSIISLKGRSLCLASYIILEGFGLQTQQIISISRSELRCLRSPMNF